ncbi:hypothetical protein EHM69_02665 [candidate division KSB1 bacterium]|nr:MAG: hypothetical protein EHM69_02665 [candidate division KSB1 bacterium]
MQWFASLWIIAIFSGLVFAQTPSVLEASPSVATPDTVKQVSDWRNLLLFDSDPVPPGFPQVNPYNILARMVGWTVPVLDHTGQPHQHGHLIQLIVDGGNGIQDPPLSDGTPGGDDSMAYGNFNMMVLQGLEEPPDPKGRSGLFYSLKFFIPYFPNRAHYLRIWEGDNIATAPYYQDTSEYDAENDRGGTMITLQTGQPMDVQWTFGPSKPRPTAPPKE